MKHKIAELDGPLLDAAVAKAEGFALRRHPGGFDLWCRPDDTQFSEAVEPGYWLGDESFRMVIERERIAVYWEEYGYPVSKIWIAGFNLEVEQGHDWGGETGADASTISLDHSASGPTALVAAMRAYVSKKFGDEVDLP